ncbi:rhomboid family intramembrane serine protease [Terrimonas alba]|uniref:rhomboid family intramembrane serine protease n=1 Tax=Terrimonas alba TaxID=3349636 RepID=UPI0035F2B7A7
MPGKIKVIAVAGLDETTSTAIAYGALEQLNWTIKYAGENILLAYTPGKWDKKGLEINIAARDNELTVSSKMVNNELFDIFGKNKKALEDFAQTFKNVQSSVGGAQINDWTDRISQLKKETKVVMEEENRLTEEIDSVMNLSKSNLYVTYGIIAINVLVFIAMVVSGVSLIDPTGEDIVKWGGNFSPYTYAGDWWRLISCVFVHIGIIHLLFNMYALYSISIYLEPMLGKTKFIVAYLCTGLYASLASLWWHETPVASAGASGAIFGLYGVFLALLSTNLIPKQIRTKLLQSIAVFVVYNLVYGIKSGVDNAAHIGGLIGGLVIGYIYYSQLRNKEQPVSGYQSSIIVVATVLCCLFVLRGQSASFKKDDSEKFSKTLEHFTIIEEMALEAMQKSDTVTKETYLLKLQKTALPDWVDCVTLFEEAEKFDLSEGMESYRIKLHEYSNQRLQQTLLLIKATKEEGNNYFASMDSIQKIITTIVAEIQQGNQVSPASQTDTE